MRILGRLQQHAWQHGSMSGRSMGATGMATPCAAWAQRGGSMLNGVYYPGLHLGVAHDARLRVCACGMLCALGEAFVTPRPCSLVSTHVGSLSCSEHIRYGPCNRSKPCHELHCELHVMWPGWSLDILDHIPAGDVHARPGIDN